MMKSYRDFLKFSLFFLTLSLFSGCENFQNRLYDKVSKDPGILDPVDALIDQAPSNEIRQDLISLPPPMGKMVTSVYNFRDQSGQYLPQPANTFSTAMPQGTLPMLMKSLRESGWFNLVEREGLQNLLTERKILRATREKTLKNPNIAPLAPANIIIEGGVLAYDSNIKTGGSGAKYFGLTASNQYREDQVTVGLRVVDVNTGRIINTVTAQRRLLSTQVMGGFFRFIRFKRLLELETGVTQNDPAQVVVQDAIDAAVIKLVISGVVQGNWALQSEDDAHHRIFSTYANPSSYEKYLKHLFGAREQAQVEAIETEFEGAPENKTHSDKTHVDKTGQTQVKDKAPSTKTDDASIEKMLAVLDEDMPLPKVGSDQVKTKPKAKERAFKNKTLHAFVDQPKAEDAFAIQIFTSDQWAVASDFIDLHLKKEMQGLASHEFWIWKMPHKAGFFYVVLLGHYETKDQAYKTLARLPIDVQMLGPWIRSLR